MELVVVVAHLVLGKVIWAHLAALVALEHP
jgi:hypothetical protein